jgi:hypothetical protein
MKIRKQAEMGQNFSIPGWNQLQQKYAGFQGFTGNLFCRVKACFRMDLFTHRLADLEISWWIWKQAGGSNNTHKLTLPIFSHPIVFNRSIGSVPIFL